MAAVFALHHPLGGVDIGVGQFGAGEDRQQQVQHLALVLRGRLDHEGGVGVAGIGIPLAAQGLHAVFQLTFSTAVDAAEQQVFQQVRQLFVLATEVVQAHAHHQADRHMPAFGARLEQQLQAIGQGVALDLQAVKGKGMSRAHEQTGEQQATHNKLPGE